MNTYYFSRYLLLSIALTFVAVGRVSSGKSNSGSLSVEDVKGLVAEGKVESSKKIAFYIRATYEGIDTIQGLVNGFRVYSPDGAEWQPTLILDTFIRVPLGVDTFLYAEWVEEAFWDSLFGQLLIIDSQSDPDTGSGADTVGLEAVRILGSERFRGMPPGTDALIWSLTIDSVSASSIGSHLCLDSSFFRSTGFWFWLSGANRDTLIPSWDGPHCFEIVADCCENERGNINLDLQGTIDISDLTYMVNWMFAGGAEPPCMLEADVNGDSNHDISDLTHLVGYMFGNGMAPMGCP